MQAPVDQAGAGNRLRGLGDLMGLKVVNGEGVYLGERVAFGWTEFPKALTRWNFLA
jgi:hypothetical protein